jgi:hypothetical protein
VPTPLRSAFTQPETLQRHRRPSTAKAAYRRFDQPANEGDSSPPEFDTEPMQTVSPTHSHVPPAVDDCHCDSMSSANSLEEVVQGSRPEARENNPTSTEQTAAQMAGAGTSISDTSKYALLSLSSSFVQWHCIRRLTNCHTAQLLQVENPCLGRYRGLPTNVLSLHCARRPR